MTLTTHDKQPFPQTELTAVRTASAIAHGAASSGAAPSGATTASTSQGGAPQVCAPCTAAHDALERTVQVPTPRTTQRPAIQLERPAHHPLENLRGHAFSRALGYVSRRDIYCSLAPGILLSLAAGFAALGFWSTRRDTTSRFTMRPCGNIDTCLGTRQRTLNQVERRFDSSLDGRQVTWTQEVAQVLLDVTAESTAACLAAAAQCFSAEHARRGEFFAARDAHNAAVDRTAAIIGGAGLALSATLMLCQLMVRKAVAHRQRTPLVAPPQEAA